MPIERPATWATMSRPVAVGAARGAPARSRHTSGSWSGWFRLTLTGAPGAAGQRLHPRPLVHRDAGVVGGELEHAVPGPGERVADGEQLVGRRRRCPAPARRPWSGAAGVRLVEKPRAPARSASSTSAAMAGAVGLGGRLVGGAPLAHHEGAQRAVGDLGADVEHLAAPRRRRRGTRGSDVHSHVMPSVMAEPGMSSTPSMSSISHSWRSARRRREARRRSCPSPRW